MITRSFRLVIPRKYAIPSPAKPRRSPAVCAASNLVANRWNDDATKPGGPGLQSKFGQTGMVVRSRSLDVPVEFALGFTDFDVVNTGVTARHQAVAVEFPVFIAIGAVPLTGG